MLPAKSAWSLALAFTIGACAPAREPHQARSASPRPLLPSSGRPTATAAAPSKPAAALPVSRTATSVALAGDRGCSVLDDGSVDCWGGARGKATRIPNLAGARDVALDPRMGMAVVLPNRKVRVVGTTGTPQDLEKLGAVVSVAMFFPTLCAARSDGKVACFRSGPWDEQHHAEPTPEIVTHISGAQQIDIGPDFGCVVETTGKVACFRRALRPRQPLRARVVPGISDAVAVRVGVSIACVLRRGGETRCFSLGLVPRRTLEPGRADALAVFQQGNDEPLICLANGLTVRCQRGDRFGDGWGMPSLDSHPIHFAGVGPIRALALLNYAVCALDARGAVLCAGYNFGGVLGRPDARFVQAPVRVSGLPKVKSVAEGEGFSCALSLAGEVYCWGGNGGKEWDPYTTVESPDLTVRKVGNMPKVQRLVVSKGYACAFTQSGESHCFLGDEWGAKRGRRAYRVPVLDSASRLILPESDAGDYAAVVDSTGHLLLGLSSADTIENLVLKPVPGFDKVQRIASSYSHLYVEKRSGAVWRLDVQQGKVSGKPVRLKPFDGAVSLDGSGFALLADGAVLEDQEGRTTTVRRQSNWTRLLAGGGPCGLTRDKEVSCWWSDSKHERVLARGVAQVSRAIFGGEQICLVDFHARARCLGNCSWGQCGARVGIFRSDTPVRVMLP